MTIKNALFQHNYRNFRQHCVGVRFYVGWVLSYDIESTFTGKKCNSSIFLCLHPSQGLTHEIEKKKQKKTFVQSRRIEVWVYSIYPIICYRTDKNCKHKHAYTQTRKHIQNLKMIRSQYWPQGQVQKVKYMHVIYYILHIH